MGGEKGRAWEVRGEEHGREKGRAWEVRGEEHGGLWECCTG